MVENEEIYWVTVLFSKGTPVSSEDAELWHETFPNEKILVLADADLTLQEHMQVEAMPRIDILDQSLFFVSFNPSGPQNGMNFISSQE
jgi:hypothetical protein